MSDFIGPALPPDLLQPIEKEDGGVEGELLVGPALPPELSVRQQYKGKEEEEGEDRSGGHQSADVFYGPSLPPGLPQEEEELIIGPVLPAHIQSEPSQTDEEEDLIGPLPPSSTEESESLAIRRREIDGRSRLMKQQLTSDTSEKAEPRREAWMTELPPEMKAFGLGARKFRSTYTETGDRSVWTDTPADKLRKAQDAAAMPHKPIKKTAADKITSSRDVRLSKEVEEYNKTHRPESLMEMHRKRKAAEGPAVKERRPFDRERDLEIQRHLVTPSKRQALAKSSAKSLESKFTHGRQAFM